MRKKTNKLSEEKSPYLLQHASNPVNWYSWTEEAFEKAKNEKKPIFLSIGYSTCHWCHVMEHESFEDEQVAALMNETFVSIKVDREERPDIDNVYMTTCQMITGSGGWPLTIMMTPDKKPFYTATYIPKTSRFGRLGMLELVPKIKDIWQNQREQVYSSADNIADQLTAIAEKPGGQALHPDLLQQTYDALSHRFDEHMGGFGERPKFPSPHNLLFLLRYYFRTKNENALKMVEKTLTQMARGGIYDHIGFGFHRYSTDKNWLLPHFEKMLYDQAMLILAYSEAYQLTQNSHYANIVDQIVTYVLRDMTSPGGGFYSAEDADSDGEEGKFYVWKKEELLKILGDESEWFCSFYNVKDDGNFVEEASQHKTGTNILHTRESPEEFAESWNMSISDLQLKLNSARKKLFEERKNRIPPYKDDKILTDWNGLLIAALATAGRVLEKPDYVHAAEKAVAFLDNNLVDSNGRLLHRFRDGEAAIPAFIDDYAFLIWGQIELHQTTQDVTYLERAISLQKNFFNGFWDAENGGFFPTADDGEKLLIRKKEIYDGAFPSGNAVAMLNLLRLARMTGNSTYEEKADQLGRAFSTSVSGTPSAHTFLLSALDFAAGPSFEIIIAGDAAAEDTQKMLAALNSTYIPNKVVILKDTVGRSSINELVDFVKEYESRDGRATAYVCQKFTCQSPTTDIKKMLKLLEVRP